MTEDAIKALFKLGSRKYMTQLLHEGVVYMNTVDYFAGLADGSHRYDPNEGAIFWVSAQSTIDIEDQGEWRPLGIITDPIRIPDANLGNANLYCLHARTSKDIGAIFSPSQLEFGDTVVLFKDGTEFLRRLEVAASSRGQELICKMVEYVDRHSYVGPMGPFRKFSEYAADQELRALAVPGLGGPLELRLGDLSDIALLVEGDKRMRMDPREL